MKFHEKNNRFNSARMRNTAIYMYIYARAFLSGAGFEKNNLFSTGNFNRANFWSARCRHYDFAASKVTRARRRDALTKDALFYRFAAPVRRKLYTVTNPARNYHVTSLAYCASGNAKD